jgi:hypothetical protein
MIVYHNSSETVNKFGTGSKATFTIRQQQQISMMIREARRQAYGSPVSRNRVRGGANLVFRLGFRLGSRAKGRLPIHEATGHLI